MEQLDLLAIQDLMVWPESQDPRERWDQRGRLEREDPRGHQEPKERREWLDQRVWLVLKGTMGTQGMLDRRFVKHTLLCSNQVAILFHSCCQGARGPAGSNGAKGTIGLPVSYLTSYLTI